MYHGNDGYQGNPLQRDLCQVYAGFPNLVWLGNINSINHRIDEDGRIWACLEISSVVIHSHRLWLFRAKSSQILNIPKDGDLADFSGHLFQCLTTLILKKNTSLYPVRTSPAASCDLSLCLSPCTSGNRNCTTISQPCASLREKAENFIKIYSGKLYQKQNEEKKKQQTHNAAFHYSVSKYRHKLTAVRNHSLEILLHEDNYPHSGTGFPI